MIYQVAFNQTSWYRPLMRLQMPKQWTSSKPVLLRSTWQDARAAEAAVDCCVATYYCCCCCSDYCCFDSSVTAAAGRPSGGQHDKRGRYFVQPSSPA